ncbi:MAG TPA: DUF4870 domain-containing protein [Bacillales bacterium]|nr:DUF4870 domain-containing protein [Bacillales bacterium]
MNDEKTQALFTHLSAFAMFFIPSFGNIIGPLVLWLIFRERSSYVDRHGKEALNFQISFTIYFIISGILCLIIIGFVLIGILFILWMIFVIVATVRASNGEDYRYPMSIRFIK